jgi:hypothetical protein
MDECIIVLQHEPIEKLEKFKNLSEEDAEQKGFNIYGFRIRKSWDLEIGSNLSWHFNKNGIYHPETMISVVLVCLHRYINGKEYNEIVLCNHFRKVYSEEEKAYKKDLKKDCKCSKAIRKSVKKLKKKEAKIIKKRESNLKINAQEIKDLENMLKKDRKDTKPPPLGNSKTSMDPNSTH